MISRTLGPDVGGTVGITLFISQAVAIAFYVIGFSEAAFSVLQNVSPDTAISLRHYHAEKILSCITIAGLFFLTFKGADIALKAQYVILAILLGSVASFLLGGFLSFDADTFHANQMPARSSGGFWLAFAIFFPAATGIDAGANMSGDLKNPAKAIPNGTLLAIGFTFVVYTLLLVLMAGHTTAAHLIKDPFGVLQHMSIFGPLVVLGVFAATLSSALSSFMGAPRILQAMGKDKLLRPFEYFAVGHGLDDEPRRATVLSLILALSVVFMGNLDAIAEIISMFFLIAYGMINLSAFVEGRAGNPSFRPRFRSFGWPAAAAGTIGCAIAMFKIDETYALLSMLLAGVLYVLIKGRTKSDWDDATRGYTFAKARRQLFELETNQADAKNWRPQIAVLTQDADKDGRMIDCASWIESGRGMLSLLEIQSPGLHNPQDTIVEAPPAKHLIRHERRKELKDILSTRQVKAMPDCFLVPTTNHIDAILQAYALGSFRPNTFMLNIAPPSQPYRRQWAFDILAMIPTQNTNVLLYKGARPKTVDAKERTVDVWWQDGHNGSLMALLAYLCCHHTAWKKSQLRILHIVDDENQKAAMQKNLEKIVETSRIKAEILVFASPGTAHEVIAENSQHADLAVLGISQHELNTIQAAIDTRQWLLEQLPQTLLVYSAGDVDISA